MALSNVINCRRIGFDIVSLGDGERKRLARTGANTGHKVGQYGVFIRDFEAVALPILSSVVPGDVVVIDEIGKHNPASNWSVFQFCLST